LCTDPAAGPLQFLPGADSGLADCQRARGCSRRTSAHALEARTTGVLPPRGGLGPAAIGHRMQQGFPHLIGAALHAFEIAEHRGELLRCQTCFAHTYFISNGYSGSGVGVNHPIRRRPRPIGRYDSPRSTTYSARTKATRSQVGQMLRSGTAIRYRERRASQAEPYRTAERFSSRSVPSFGERVSSRPAGAVSRASPAVLPDRCRGVSAMRLVLRRSGEKAFPHGDSVRPWRRCQPADVLIARFCVPAAAASATLSPPSMHRIRPQEARSDRENHHASHR
jgi:hypothetical protein